MVTKNGGANIAVQFGSNRKSESKFFCRKSSRSTGEVYRRDNYDVFPNNRESERREKRNDTIRRWSNKSYFIKEHVQITAILETNYL